jgi:hypothetical protein
MEVRVQAEMLISAYIAPRPDRSPIINELTALSERPQQREAQTLAAEALEDPRKGVARPWLEGTRRARAARGRLPRPFQLKARRSR